MFSRSRRRSLWALELLLFAGQTWLLAAGPAMAINSDTAYDESAILQKTKELLEITSGHHAYGIARNPDHVKASQFDSYTLALTWAPAFCDARKLKTKLAECVTQTADRFDAKHLSLHGLWPNRVDRDGLLDSYKFCGVAHDIQMLDERDGWCAMPKLDLSEETRKSLAVSMPGQMSCLDHHEWYKHGTCSGLSADDYFSLADDLVAQVAETHFGRYLASNIGSVVDSEQLLAEFRKDFGAESDRFISFRCKPKRGSHLLLEVKLFMKNTLSKGSALKDVLVQPAFTPGGNCPEKFIINPVR